MSTKDEGMTVSPNDSKPNVRCCAGCGYEFKSTRPEKYYQFCSVECRDVVETEVEEIVDDRQFIRLLNDGNWLQPLLNIAARYGAITYSQVKSTIIKHIQEALGQFISGGASDTSLTGPASAPATATTITADGVSPYVEIY